MTELPMVEIFGYWLGVFLTFCILSFLYADNPFYKFAEHLFIGISIGYIIVQQAYNVLKPKLIDNLINTDPWPLFPIPYWLLYTVPLLLVLMMFVKAASRRWAWVGRYPLAFVVAFFAGLQINGVVQADLGQQLARAAEGVDVAQININEASEDKLITLPGISPAVAEKIVEQRQQRPFGTVDELEQMPSLTDGERSDIIEARRAPDAVVYRAWVAIDGLDARASVDNSDRYWFRVVSNVLMLLGTLCSLVYFYFSVAHRGVLGRVSRAGIWVLMVGFGASFGYTVMGRLSLAIGRAQYVMGYKDATIADQVGFQTAAVVSILVIIVGLVVWELRRRRVGADDEG